MIKLICDFCEDDVGNGAGGSLTYVKIISNLENPGQTIPERHDTHLCDSCLDKALKAMEKKK